MIIVLLTFVIINNKRKRMIKAALEGKWEKLKTGNVGGYISALREGADGTISKEDIKKEKQAMKDKAKSDKEKAQKATEVQLEPESTTAYTNTHTAGTRSGGAVSPTMATGMPVQAQEEAPPAPAPVIDLSGAKINPDMTVTSGGRVIGTLSGDGAINDGKGNMIGKVDLSTGAVVDVDGDHVGHVGGDGTIQ